MAVPKAKSEVADEKRQAIKDWDALEANPMWSGRLEPQIRRDYEQACAKHEDETLPPEKRAEWLQAMKMLRGILVMIDEQRERAKKYLKEHREDLT